MLLVFPCSKQLIKITLHWFHTGFPAAPRVLCGLLGTASRAKGMPPTVVKSLCEGGIQKVQGYASYEKNCANCIKIILNPFPLTLEVPL